MLDVLDIFRQNKDKSIILRGWTPVNQAKEIDQNNVAEIEKSLRMIAGIIKQKGREMLADYEITPPQFIALQWLLEHGDLTIGELSSKMFLACSTTTDLIDRMEKNELVTRVRDEKDRRVVQIHLLPKGNDIISEVIKKRQQYLSDKLEGFSKEEVEALQKSMHQLHQHMQED
ncbi:MarR family transcriptional regulator [Lottiidibacillus patelloidae]|uniref:MarR family transcriptional regulator n=2 Tax=Lottiidibacillus patelloidae TaxID=2670334 RepID=A0A263BWE3_9BACI|nr:MarR family transcriptional regulator [Lottiidibacillus patelloidae]